MCANYKPVTRLDRLLSFFDAAPAAGAPTPDEVFPLGLAPFIRLAPSGLREVVNGQFGLLPGFAKEVAYGRKTYNARSETVNQLPSYRTSWARGMRCIVPTEVIFEQCYETGAPVRWAIQNYGQVPLAIAGVWAENKSLKMPDGSPMLSFSMLTVNADGHPIFQRMHRPGDEKRMVVILDLADQDRWLGCSVEEAPTFFRQWQGELEAFASPLPPRAKKDPAPKLAKARPKLPPPPQPEPPATGELF